MSYATENKILHSVASVDASQLEVLIQTVLALGGVSDGH